MSRSLIEGLPQLPTLTQRHFLFDWDYNVGYNLTRSLQFNFRAANNYIYDDFDRTEDEKLREVIKIERSRIISKLIDEKQNGNKVIKAKNKIQRLYHCNTIEGIAEEETGQR